MSKFIYKVSEKSEDTRNYKIESDRSLTYDEIVEFVSDCGSGTYEPHSYELNSVKVKYIDTDWGEDTDYGIESDCNCDPINEYLCFDHEREAIKEKYPNAVYTDQCTWEVDGKEVEL